LSQETLNRLSIPDDLPDIVNLHKNDFAGSVAPGAAEPSKLGTVGVDEKNEAMPIKRSWSGTWLLSVIVSKGRMEPVRCAWIQSKLIDTKRIFRPLNNPCIRYWGIMKDEYFFAKDLNGAPGTKVDGAPMRVKDTPACNRNRIMYANYATDYYGPLNLSFPETGGGLYHEVRKLEKNELVFYRYTTRDDQAIYVRTVAKDGEGGWGYLPRDCRTDEVPKGGADKTGDTQPGANPNGGRIFDTRVSLTMDPLDYPPTDASLRKSPPVVYRVRRD
jgi:hypothetical protein